MSDNFVRVCKRYLAVVALFALWMQTASANNGPLVSGSYEVLHSTALGSQAQIRIRIHLTNHGSSDLLIQKIILWDFSHPEKGGMHACSVALRAHGAGELTQEFTIPRSEYQLWQKGSRPRFVLEMSGSGGANGKTVVRLDRISGQEAK
jgi:hypothetical protein